MRDKELYTAILGIVSPWKVVDVELSPKEEEVRVLIRMSSGVALSCPTCGEPCPGYDTRRRSWRHLDTCQFKTILDADVPRVKCEEHGVLQTEVPWGAPGSGFTALMEALILDWLKEASVLAVARRMDLTWDQVDGVMQRAVKRGLARRAVLRPKRIGVDETSFQKRHEYVTVVADQDTGNVLYVANDRTSDSLEGFFQELEPDGLLSIESVSMDMWAPYIKAFEQALPKAEEKICFDRFHVAKHLGDAVDKVRRQEHREKLGDGDRTLVGTRYTWLKNRGESEHASFARLQRNARRTARAWEIKELARTLWCYTTRGWARRAWRRWLSRAIRSRLEPIKRVARMVRRNLEGILNAIAHRATNATSESLNAKIQRVKRMACGFRNRERFRAAIYFHLGGLNLLPATHTDS